MKNDVLKSLLVFFIIIIGSSQLFSQDESLFIDSEKLNMFDDRIEFYKNSEISKGDFFLKGERYTIYRKDGKERQIVANEGIYLEFETGKATALTLDYDLIDEKGQMTGDVIAHVSSKQSSQTIVINCDILDIDNSQGMFSGKMFEGNKRVELVRGDLIARSNSFEYFEKEDILILYEDVFIDDVKNAREITGNQITLTLADDSIEGKNVSIINKSSDEKESFEIESDDFKMFDDRTEFYKPSTVKKGDFLLRSPNFIVYKQDGQERRVVSNQRSYVEFETGNATSNELEYDLKTQSGTLKGDVLAVIKPDEASTEVIVRCDSLEIDGQSKTYNGEVNESEKVRLNRGSLYAESKKFSYSAEDQVVVLTEQAYIDDLDNDQRIWGDEVQIGLESDSLEGSNIRLTKQSIKDGEKETVQMKSERFVSLENVDQFRGPSEITTKKLTLVSEQMDVIKVDGQQKTIEATEGVFVEFDTGSATSTSMAFDLDTNQGTLTRDVNARITRVGEEQEILIACDLLNIDQDKGYYKGAANKSEKVIITKGNLRAESNSFEYDEETQDLILIDEVSVVDPDNRRTVKGDRLKMNLETDETEGTNIQMTIITKK